MSNRGSVTDQCFDVAFNSICFCALREFDDKRSLQLTMRMRIGFRLQFDGSRVRPCYFNKGHCDGSAGDYGKENDSQRTCVEDFPCVVLTQVRWKEESVAIRLEVSCLLLMDSCVLECVHEKVEDYRGEQDWHEG